MNWESELEEMACILSGECKSGCKTCSHLSEWGCAEYDRAIELQKSGYGKVKEAVKEFKEQVKIELEKYRLDNEEKTDEGFVFNSSQFCVEVICDGGLIDEAFKKLYGEDKESK